MATFPAEKPEPGGKIFATDLETTYAAVNKLGGVNLSGLGGISSRSRLVVGGLPPAKSATVEIVAQATDGDGDAVEGVYSCAMRYYTPAASGQGTWSSMANLWLLDATDSELILTIRDGETPGSIIPVYWDEQRSAFVAAAVAVTVTSWYQLIGDNDSEIYTVKANPGVFSTDTGFLYDEHWDDVVPDNPSWTVLLIDGTGLTPCWKGDWVQAEAIDYTLPNPYDEYQLMMITSRASAQLQFWGLLGGSPLAHLGSISAFLYINGRWVVKTVYDGGLLISGQSLPEYTTIIATYFPGTRRFYVTNAPCGAPFL